MIYSSINAIHEHQLSDLLNQCINYAKTHDLLSYECGRHDISEDIFVNIVSYETKNREERFFEAHRDYLDVHIMLEGKEIIDINDIDQMRQDAFRPDEDFLPVFGDKKISVLMEKNDVLICYPHDAHQTAVKVNEAISIKKAIFKVKI